MKKSISMLLAALMLTGALSGCGLFRFFGFSGKRQ